jgi:hypothetical protein
VLPFQGDCEERPGLMLPPRMQGTTLADWVVGARTKGLGERWVGGG